MKRGKGVQQRRMRNEIKSFAKIKDSTNRGGGIKGLLPQVSCGDESEFSTKTWAKTKLTIRRECYFESRSCASIEKCFSNSLLTRDKREIGWLHNGDEGDVDFGIEVICEHFLYHGKVPKEIDWLNKSESEHEIKWAVDFNILASGPGEVSVGSWWIRCKTCSGVQSKSGGGSLKVREWERHEGELVQGLKLWVKMY